MISNTSNIAIRLSIAPIAACIVFTAAAYAEQAPERKIPYEVEEGPPVKMNPADRAAPTGTHRMALGLAVDPFPTILSAVSEDFGISVQPWFGVDHVKIRLDITRVRLPDSILRSNYFYNNDVNAFSLNAEYLFGEEFNGFRIGAGIGIWQNVTGHRYFNKKAHALSPFLNLEGGYVWEFHRNLYIEPCVALEIMLTRPVSRVYGFSYTPIPVAGEISLKFGMFIDL